MHRCLIRAGVGRLAQVDVLPVGEIVRTFGFHLAALDIRQNSHFHDLAVAQLLTAAGVDGSDFSNWSEENRVRFLNTELMTPRPFTRPDMKPGAEAEAVLGCYRVVAEHLNRHGPSGLGALIVSMTRSLSDLLVVYLLAREVGLLFSGPDGQTCHLPVVPLFETIDDLKRSPAIVRTFLDHPITRRALPTSNAETVWQRRCSK